MDVSVKNGKDKIVLMITLLSDAKGELITTSELMEKLGCNRNSVNNYYKRCIQLGIGVKKAKKGHETGFFIDMEETVYEPLTPDMMRKYLIMQSLVPGASKKQELTGSNFREADEEIDIKERLGNISTSKYYELLSELEEEGEILKIDNKYYPGRKKIPVAWVVNEERATQYMRILAMMPPGHHGQKQIRSIFEKINALLGDEERDESSYIVIGRVYTVLNRIMDLLSDLGSVDYINKLVRLKYIGKNGNVIDHVIAIGLIVYSVEKDKLYLVGERRGSDTDRKSEDVKKEMTVFLDVEKIKDVREEKGRNRCYHSVKFKRMYNRMFSIGSNNLVENTDDCGRVSIAFTKDEYILDRLENLCKYREKSDAAIKEYADEWVYSDHIVGLDDFFKFLRQFTGNYRIINSDPLKKKKADSLKLMLDRYTEE